MKKDEYSFLELFGNIDDEYITQALQPWKGQTRRFMIYHIGRKAACLAIIVMLGLCLAFHDQVSAAVSRFTTMIAEILQVTDDMTSYTDIINTTQEKNGISVTLNEVVLSENALYASVKLDDVDGDNNHGISVGENIKIDGKEYECNSSRVYQKKNLEENDKQYVVEWIYDDGVPLKKKANIEITIVVHKKIEDVEGEPFTFTFVASKEDLQNNVVHLELNQRISLDEKEVIIKEFSINSVMSILKIEGDEFFSDKNLYYVEMTDIDENKFFYYLVSNKGKQYIFQTDGDVPSSDSKWLEGQIYMLPYNDDINDTVDEKVIQTEISEIFRVDTSDMLPVGKKFKIDIKNFHETRNYR